MVQKIIDKLRHTWTKAKKRAPLVSPKQDLHILRTVRGARRPHIKQMKELSRVLTSTERFVYRGALVVLVLSICWLTAVVVRGYRVPVPAVGGTYREAIVGEPELINPLFASLNDADQDISRLVYSGIMRYDEQGRLVNDLAAKIDINEDKTVYTVSLRKDVFWHDGEAFDADDVLFTMSAIQNPDVGSPLYVTFDGVKVEEIDTHTVVFTLKEAFPAFGQALTVGMLPEHEWFDVLPERFPLTQKNLQPIGTGPYQFSKFSKDASGYIYEYELKRNEAYYRSPAYIENFIFSFYRSYDGEAGAIQDLRQQALDGLHFVPVDLKEKVERKHLALRTLQLPQYTALFFNSTREPALADDAVREALAHALDKRRILREALGGEGQLIEGPILPGFPGFDESLEVTTFDVAAARELLDEDWPTISAEEYRTLRETELIEQLIAERQAEVDAQAASNTTTEDIIETDDGVPTLENTVDTPFSDELAESTVITSSSVKAEVEQILAGLIDPSQTIYRQKGDVILELDVVTVDTQEYRDAAALIEAAWQEIGITVNVAYVPAKDLARTVLADRSYDVLLYGVIVGADPDQFPFWHSSQQTAPGLNLSLYDNEDLDALLELARVETDEEKLTELYSQIQATLIKDRPAIFLYMPTYTYVQTTDVSGFTTNRIFIPADRLNGVTNWYLRTKGIWKRAES